MIAIVYFSTHIFKRIEKLKYFSSIIHNHAKYLLPFLKSSLLCCLISIVSRGSQSGFICVTQKYPFPQSSTAILGLITSHDESKSSLLALFYMFFSLRIGSILTRRVFSPLACRCVGATREQGLIGLGAGTGISMLVGDSGLGGFSIE